LLGKQQIYRVKDLIRATIDDKVTSRADLVKLKPANGDAEEWKAFSARVDVTALYYELKI
jgi:hypothetical protein